MEQYLWTVNDTLLLTGRGLILTADIRECDACKDVSRGQLLQVRRPDGAKSTFSNFTTGHYELHEVVHLDVSQNIAVSSEVSGSEGRRRQPRHNTAASCYLADLAAGRFLHIGTQPCL